MPPKPWTGYHRLCPLSLALDLLGERWTLVIAHELSFGPARFSELDRRLPGISPNLLTARLRKLEEAQLVERSLGDAEDGVRYQLSEDGQQLLPIFGELRAFGMRRLAQPSDNKEFATTHDLAQERTIDEEYEWSVDDDVITFAIQGRDLTQRSGPATNPTLQLKTTGEFLERLGRLETTWDDGLDSNEVELEGDLSSWGRMINATGLGPKIEPDDESHI